MQELSQLVTSLTDCEIRTGIEVTSSGKTQSLENYLKNDMPVLGLAGCH